MAERCASCGGWLTPGADCCDACQAPVATAPGAGRVDLDDPLGGYGAGELELDLDLPGPPGASSGGRAAAPTSASTPSDGDAFGGRYVGGDDPLHAEPPGAGPALELDAAPRRSRPGPTPEVASPPAEPRRPSTRPPGASSRGRALYDAEVHAFADYGAAPSGLLSAVPYALNVLGRRQQLKAGLRDAKVARAGAEAAARRALVEVGRAIVDRTGELDLGEVARELEAVRQAEAELGERAQRSSAARSQMEAQRSALSEQIAAAQAEANPWRDKETKLVTQLRVREGELARARAKLERVDIEIRNIHRQAEQGTEVDRDRLAALQADKQARKVEVQRAEGPVAELVRELASVRHELAARLGKVTQLEELRRQAEQQMRREESAHEAGAGEASKQLEQAQHDLGLAAHLRQLDRPLGPLATRAEGALESYEQRKDTEEMHARALEAYDKPAFHKGVALVGGAALVVLVMLVFVVVR